jgi:Flp pilus assembly protein TadD
MDAFPRNGLRGLEACCRDFWERRTHIAWRLHGENAAGLEPAVRDDLLDLAIFLADLQARLAVPGEKKAARRQAVLILDQAEAMFGPSAVLDLERQFHAGAGCANRDQAAPSPAPAPALTGPLSPDPAPESAWQHYALARALLRNGETGRAAQEAARAVRLQPQGLWPNFNLGLCAYRQGRYLDAALAYSVCIGAAPDVATCFANRGLAFDALGRSAEAFADYSQALQLDPALNVAALNRGVLHYRQHQYAEALADLTRARELGAEPAVVAFDLALVHLARGDQAAARDELRQTLLNDPQQHDARRLLDQLGSR